MCSLLSDNRFAVVVRSDVPVQAVHGLRDKDGVTAFAFFMPQACRCEIRLFIDDPARFFMAEGWE